jgi:TonB dependent receptor-like, beta-barrel/Carboxypeptidase regulatory-like domain
MRSTMSSSAVVGGLVLLCLAPVATAQTTVVAPRPVTHLASVPPGTILGSVLDERGAPVVGAMVSALGATSAFAVSDRSGRFELRTLPPGPYLVRAHLVGFVASRGQVVEVRPSGRASSSIALRHANPVRAASPLLAGVGGGEEGEPVDGAVDDPSVVSPTDDHSELAWRLRHIRRGILKDAEVDLLATGGDDPDLFGPATMLSRAVGTPGRLATAFIAGTPFSGQVNLLTTGMFDSPQQLFTADNFSRSIAYLALSAPVGESADWTMRAALTQGDIASWIVSGQYATRAPARHRYDVGLAYSTQRYDGGNFAALRSVTDGSRNAGSLYAFDAFSITPAVTLSYGGRYARYDYLDGASLISPRVALTVAPSAHLRFTGAVSRRALAPGAEEFMPRFDSGVWLPPQRTFSSLTGRPLAAERTDHAEIEVEHDIAATTVSVRAFKQQVEDQLVTLFGLDMLGAPAALGHYFINNSGDVSASGMSAGLRTAIAGRLRGSVEYTVARARFTPADSAAYLFVLAPSALRVEPERVYDLATAIETDVPETSTRVVVLYRVSNAFSRSSTSADPVGAKRPVQPSSDIHPGLDSRFDVQVRQALPFMDFSTAKWEMLIGVRNFFRDAAPDQSVYDELLVVRPPKRIVGGLTLKF